MSEDLMDFLVYSICFGVGLLFAIISAFVGHLFGGHDAHGHGLTNAERIADGEHRVTEAKAPRP